MKGKQDVEEEHVINTPIFFLLVWSLKIVHSNAGQMLTYLKAGHIEYIYIDLSKQRHQPHLDIR